MTDIGKEIDAVLNRQADLIDIKIQEDRDLTEDEQNEYDRLEARADRLSEAEKQKASHAGRSAYWSERTTQGIRPGEGAGSSVEGSTVSVGWDREASKPYRNFGEQMLAIRQASELGASQQPDKRLIFIRDAANRERRALGLGGTVDNDGGFLVQKDFAAGIHHDLHATGTLLGQVQNVPLSGNANSLDIKAVDETSRATGSRWGGVQTYWEAEAASATKSKPQFRNLS